MERRSNINLGRKLRRSMTDSEIRLWQSPRRCRLLGYKFRRQAPIGNYVTDFSCPEARLFIELDGGQHLEQAADDELRTAKLVELGFRVQRFWNDNVMLRLDDVLEQNIAVLRELENSGQA
jgi:very-short-patch-repair endonuclease